jgi:sacsin
LFKKIKWFFFVSRSPNAIEILSLLMRLSSSATTLFGSFEDSLRDEWSLFLSSGTFPNHPEKEFIKKLPIFKARNFTTRNCEFFTYLTNPGIKIEPLEILTDLPPDGIPFAQTLVRCQSNSASSNLALKVGLATMTWQEFILSLLNQTSFSKYNSDQRESLIHWLLPSVFRFYLLPDQVRSTLKFLKFIPFAEDKNVLESPMCLFNPSEPKLKDLFLNETKFPQGIYSQEPLLKILKELGLQEMPQPDDIINSAKRILPDRSLSSVDSTLKSNAVVYWLESMAAKNALPQDKVQQLLAIPFLKVLETPPADDYPQGLIWAGSLPGTGPFASPKECAPKSFLRLIASTMPLSETEITSDQLLNGFGWKNKALSPIVQHLKNLSKLDLKPKDVFEKRKVTKMLEEIYSCLSNEDLDLAVKELAGCCWIWNGEGFSRPQEICVNSDGLSLKPYLFNIPDEFKVFENIFLHANANPGLTHDILINVLNSIKDYHNSDETMSRQNDLKTVISILEWLAENAKSEQILLPIQRINQKLELKPILECMYFNDWTGDDLEDCSNELDGRVYVVHHDVSKNLAQMLGVPSMTNQMLGADEFGFEEFGQNEPLTQRIKNILEDYPDTIGIFKELLQNADDAGATEVTFVVDHRSNTDSLTGLIDPGMKACHGSALWAYNNAEFTEADFVNIQKLGGQTKKDLVDKIGRFGIGFNAVYHVTDVPSFVSGNQVVFLDPYTNHLNGTIRNKTKPGLKIDFMNRKLLQKFRGQFKPFDDMFGCHIIPSQDRAATPFKGTLFRLPFRTRLQVFIFQCFFIL